MKPERGLALLALMSVFAAQLCWGQIGEVAGALNFVVSPGSVQTLNWTVISAGNDSVSFVAIASSFNATPGTKIPTISISPTNGTIAPASRMKIAVTVDMPNQAYNPGAEWRGYLSATETPNASSGGAQILPGVLKAVTIIERTPAPSVSVSNVNDSATITAKCPNPNDLCAIQAGTLGNTVASGTGSAQYSESNISAGTYAFYANDLSQNVNSLPRSFVVEGRPTAQALATVDYSAVLIAIVVVAAAAIVVAMYLKKKR